MCLLHSLFDISNMVFLITLLLNSGKGTSIGQMSILVNVINTLSSKLNVLECSLVDSVHVHNTHVNSSVIVIVVVLVPPRIS